MNSVRVDKDELLNIVYQNKDRHRREFEKAMQDYKRAILHYLDKMIGEISENKLVRHTINLPQPQDHTSDYERVIAMLEMSQDTIIELSDTEFSRYVQDNWGWRGDFDSWAKTTSDYLVANRVTG